MMTDFVSLERERYYIVYHRLVLLTSFSPSTSINHQIDPLTTRRISRLRRLPHSAGGAGDSCLLSDGSWPLLFCCCFGEPFISITPSSRARLATITRSIMSDTLRQIFPFMTFSWALLITDSSSSWFSIFHVKIRFEAETQHSLKHM